MINAQNLLKHEFIGLRARILESKDPSLLKIEGEVMDEGKNIFTILAGGKLKKVLKGSVVFAFYLPEAKVWAKVKGSALLKRSWERIKG